MPRTAVILAAGRGTRLRPLTDRVPKPMLPVGDRPLLEHILGTIRDEAGVERVALVTGYRSEQIEEAFGDGSRIGLDVRYCLQTTRDGTARALLLAREVVGTDAFLLVWGDILIQPAEYARIDRQFREQSPDGILAVRHVEDPSAGGAVTLGSDDRIEAIVEKPPPGTAGTPWINAGIGIFRPAIFPYLERVAPSPRGEYEIPDALTAMLSDGCELRGFRLAGTWIDVGTPTDLDRAREWLGGAQSS